MADKGAENNLVLTINVGSSSIKFALFRATSSPDKISWGAVENIGQPDASFVVYDAPDDKAVPRQVSALNHRAAAKVLRDWIAGMQPGKITAVGHRIVHGGPLYAESCIIDGQVMAGLRKLIVFDPEHLPNEIQLIEDVQEMLPGVLQIACFDTGFHHNLPTEARLLPIPRRYEATGLRRYGFHGLSYAYLMEELKRVAGEKESSGRIIMAHLGNGVSLAAVRNYEVVDTSMGLTPTGGVPMGTRSGDLDPGLIAYLAQSESLGFKALGDMAAFESGLLGISETTSDMKKLLEIEHQDTRAADAINLFCYQVKKCIGAYAAALGGLDTLVFSGGMGENAPKIRARICDGLAFLGIALDDRRNEAGEGIVSHAGSQVVVRMMHTDEAVTIAREVTKIISDK
jgi:acetate kinase